MIAIATIRLKLTMMDARLNVERPDILSELRERRVRHDAIDARCDLAKCCTVSTGTSSTAPNSRAAIAA